MCALWVLYGFEMESAWPIWPPSLSLSVSVSVSLRFFCSAYRMLYDTSYYPRDLPHIHTHTGVSLFPFGSFVTALLTATVFTGNAIALLPYPQ